MASPDKFEKNLQRSGWQRGAYSQQDKERVRKEYKPTALENQGTMLKSAVLIEHTCLYAYRYAYKKSVGILLISVEIVPTNLKHPPKSCMPRQHAYLPACSIRTAG